MDLEEGECLSSDQVSTVGLDNSTKRGDRSRNRLLAKESENTQHSQSSIVDFSLQTLSFGFF